MSVLAALCAGLAIALLVGGPGPSVTWGRIAADPYRRAGVPRREPTVRLGGTLTGGSEPSVRPGGVCSLGSGPSVRPGGVFSVRSGPSVRPGGAFSVWSGQSTRLAAKFPAGSAGRLTRSWARSRVAERTSGEVTEACLAMVAELRTGTPPREALAVVAGSHPHLLGRPAARVSLGGDAPPALREAARIPGAGALHAFAAAWEVSERSGARLADVLTAVADGLRADEAVRREAGSQLASVRATTRLLAVLPVLTLLVMSGGGGRPTAFLLGTPVGWACLSVGVGLTVAGLVWVERMAAAATRSPWATG